MEEIIQAFADAISIQRRSFWVIGDIVSEALKKYPDQKTNLLGTFANLAHCSKARIVQYLQVSETFPPDVRFPDKPHSLYLKVFQRARALGIDPLQLLDLAIQNEWSERDVAEYGREDNPRISFRKTCGVCLSMVAVITQKAGATVTCPICGTNLGVAE